MNLPVSVDLGSWFWALGLCGLLGLLVLCATCIVLSVTARAEAPEVLKAFAEVVGAFRSRRLEEARPAVGDGEPARRLEADP